MRPHLHLYTLTGIKICACMPGDFSVSDRVHISAKFVGFIRVTVGVLTFNTFFIQLYSPPESNNFPQRSTRRVFNGGEQLDLARCHKAHSTESVELGLQDKTRDSRFNY